MPLLRSYKGRRLLFVHIPKTGGQTIEAVYKARPKTTSLYGQRGKGEHKVDLNHLTLSEIIASYPDVFHLAQEVFTVVRNPYDRMVSLYLFQSEKWEKPKKRPYLIWRPRIDFQSFLLTIRDLINKNSKSPLFQPRFCNISPMSNFLLYQGELPDYLKILRFEKYQKDVLSFMQGENSPKPFNLKILPVINSSRRNKKKETFLTKAARKLIYEIYAQDFELFNYER